MTETARKMVLDDEFVSATELPRLDGDADEIEGSVAAHHPGREAHAALIRSVRCLGEQRF